LCFFDCCGIDNKKVVISHFIRLPQISTFLSKDCSVLPFACHHANALLKVLIAVTIAIYVSLKIV